MSPSLARWTPADLEAKFTRPTPNAAGERPVRARGWIVWHVAEHDVYHGGEISLPLGMDGLRGLGLFLDHGPQADPLTRWAGPSPRPWVPRRLVDPTQRPV